MQQIDEFLTIFTCIRNVISCSKIFLGFS